jgi:hypothetical protein
MHKMVVFAKAKDGQKDALSNWYDETHLPDMLAVPGLVSAERHTLMTLKQPDGLPQWDFMVVYEIEGPDAMVALTNLGKAQIPLSDLMESTSTLSVLATSQGVRTGD